MKRIIKSCLIIVVVIFFLLILFSLANSCITREEFEDLSKLVYLEAGAESFEAQFVVASVVFNLRDAGYWGDSIEEVINYPNLFSPADKIQESEGRCDMAVAASLAFRGLVPQRGRYFRASRPHNWPEYETWRVIDNIYFGYFTSNKYH